MRGLILFTLFLLQVAISNAQSDYQDWGQAYGFKVGDKKYIYADTANIRTGPRQDAPVSDKLRQGEEITILRIDSLFVMNGKEAPWSEVSYIKGGSTQKGYLWTGLLSPRSLSKNGVLFIYGMKFVETPGSSLVDIKALLGDSVIARISFKVDPIETAKGSHDAELLPSKGLTGLSCLLRLSYSGEACAIPTIHQYIGWDGSKFTMLPQIYDEVDAGAYLVEQKYIFPADKGGKPNEIRMRELIEQYDGDDKPTSRKVKVTRYSWNSGGLRKM